MGGRCSQLRKSQPSAPPPCYHIIDPYYPLVRSISGPDCIMVASLNQDPFIPSFRPFFITSFFFFFLFISRQISFISIVIWASPAHCDYNRTDYQDRDEHTHPIYHPCFRTHRAFIHLRSSSVRFSFAPRYR